MFQLTRSIFIFTLFLGSSSTVWAADEIDQALDKLFASLNMEKTQDRTIDALVANQIQQNPKINVVRAEYTQFMKDCVGWKSIEPDIRALYRKTFTKDELVAIGQFYASPAGQKAAKVLPEIMSESMKMGQQKVQAKLPAFLKSIEPKLKAAAGQK